MKKLFLIIILLFLASFAFCREINSALDINATTLAGKWQIVGKDS